MSLVNFGRLAEVKINIRNENFDGFIGSLTISDLRIAFQIRKNISWSTNTGNIQIWNLNNDRRASIQDFGNEFILSAGYAEGGGLQELFRGYNTTASHIFENPDIITSITAGDGEDSLNQRRLSFSAKAGTPARLIVKQIAEQLGLDLVKFAESENIIYEHGFQSGDMAKDALDKVTKYLGLTWTVQNGDLLVIQNNIGASSQVFTIDQDNGMIGTPTKFISSELDLFKKVPTPKTGWIVKTVLKPNLIPSDNVRLKSENLNIDQICYINRIQHIGDTHSSNWMSIMELIQSE